MYPDNIFNKTLSEMINAAISDGKITEYEFKILEKVSQDLTSNVEQLNKYKSNGIITKKEGKLLQSYKQNLVTNAEKSLFL